MSDPTGRHRTEALPDEQPRGSQVALPTDLDKRPVDQVPRPFTREALESEEQEIKDGILRMGSIVAERMIAAVEALETHDAEAALAVILSDVELNEAQARVTDLVAQTIARQQPVARDLRFLIALDHVAYDLERMGDHASSVAKQARKLAPHAPLQEHVRLPEMGRLVAQQVRDILDAVVIVDEARAREVAARDDDVDALYHGIFDDDPRAHARRPGQRGPGRPHPLRRALPGAHRRPRHEHRRGHRVPGHRLGRGPQSLTAPAPRRGPLARTERVGSTRRAERADGPDRSHPLTPHARGARKLLTCHPSAHVCVAVRRGQRIGATAPAASCPCR